jgi:hypothetical protein
VTYRSSLLRAAWLPALALIIVSEGCAHHDPPSPPPPVSDAVYALPLTMVYNSAAKRYLVHFAGQLPWKTQNGCKNQVFGFSDFPSQPATLEVWIKDTAGLLPGDRFEYALVFDRPGGFQQETFTLVAANPITATTRKYDFPYTTNNGNAILTNESDPNLLWQHPGVPIEGDYSIVTDRDMQITLKFTLEQTIPNATGPACGLPY